MEGGVYPWRVQPLDQHRGKPADYTQLLRPLPDLPKGKQWVKDENTREWRVVTTDDYPDIRDGNWKADPDDGVVTRKSGVVIDADDTELHIDMNVDTVEINKYRLPNGCDYLLHRVQETDTFQGICLKYKLKPIVLRQTNCFSGNSLLSAPDVLVIPIQRKG